MLKFILVFLSVFSFFSGAKAEGINAEAKALCTVYASYSLKYCMQNTADLLGEDQCMKAELIDVKRLSYLYCQLYNASLVSRCERGDNIQKDVPCFRQFINKDL